MSVNPPPQCSSKGEGSTARRNTGCKLKGRLSCQQGFDNCNPDNLDFFTHTTWHGQVGLYWKRLTNTAKKNMCGV